MADAKADNKFEEVVHKFEPQSKLLRTWELKGGVSAQLTALVIERTDGSTKKMIVRQHGEVDLKHNPHIAADEFKLLELLHSEGLAVSKPYYLDQSGEIFATPYMVIEYLEGETILAPKNVTDIPTMGDASVLHIVPQTASQHPHSPRPHETTDTSHRFEIETEIDFIPKLVMQLLRIHQVDCSNLGVSFLPRHAEKVAEKLGKRPAIVDEALDEGRIRDVLEAVWPLPEMNTSVLLHGDFWPGNILWRDGHIVGVVDWEDAALGDPLADVANSRLEMLWAVGIDAMRRFTHLYQSLTDIDFSNLPYWELYTALIRNSQIAEWGLDYITETTMRERLRWFVAQAFEMLAAH
jgi:aminoglycoside phosphotransferase (APT) family kinase protein